MKRADLEHWLSLVGRLTAEQQSEAFRALALAEAGGGVSVPAPVKQSAAPAAVRRPPNWNR